MPKSESDEEPEVVKTKKKKNEIIKVKINKIKQKGDEIDLTDKIKKLLKPNATLTLIRETLSESPFFWRYNVEKEKILIYQIKCLRKIIKLF
jgi:hypothetical protein